MNPIDPPEDGRAIRGTYTHESYVEAYATDQPAGVDEHGRALVVLGFRGGMRTEVDPVWARKVYDFLESRRAAR